MNKDEYVIINRTAIQKRIKQLKQLREIEPDNYEQSYLNGKIKVAEELLSQSTPLIPIVEKAYNEAFDNGITTSFSDEYATMKQILKDDREDYIKQLTLKI